jgi:hypothetical protein
MELIHCHECPLRQGLEAVAAKVRRHEGPFTLCAFRFQDRNDNVQAIPFSTPLGKDWPDNLGSW